MSISFDDAYIVYIGVRLSSDASGSKSRHARTTLPLQEPVRVLAMQTEKDQGIDSASHFCPLPLFPMGEIERS
jgi:hypothetical protein